MQIHISPRHIKLTGAIHAYVAEKVGHLEHLEGHIIGAHIAICHDEARGAKHAFVVKIHLALPGPDLHAEDHGHDLYAAIDFVTTRLAEQLRHRKSKFVKGRRTNARKAKNSRLGLDS
jgi:putative sigma-54 modulation protein